jgi:AraC family ethanolamine operon transcriptional activator
MNPVAYLKLLRLNGARRDLLAAAGTNATQVQDVIARWGFWHFSRFSAEYKQMFQELPSETLHGRKQARSVQ